ncbi:hypothetical protein GCM10020218_077740 [Dactylosporangium vinaceum]
MNPGRTAAARSANSASAGSGRQRADGHEHLAGQPERLPARRKHAQPRARAEQRADQPGDGVQGLLTVVQDEQQFLAGEGGLQPPHGIGAAAGGQAAVAQPERRGDLQRYPRRVLDGGQVGEAGSRPGRLHREPRLAGLLRARRA